MGPRQSIENIQKNENLAKLEKTVEKLHQQMPGGTAKNQEMVLRHLHGTITTNHETTEESLRNLFITTGGVMVVIMLAAFIIFKLFKRFRRLEKSIKNLPKENGEA